MYNIYCTLPAHQGLSFPDLFSRTNRLKGVVTLLFFFVFLGIAFTLDKSFSSREIRMWWRCTASLLDWTWIDLLGSGDVRFRFKYAVYDRCNIHMQLYVCMYDDTHVYHVYIIIYICVCVYVYMYVCIQSVCICIYVDSITVSCMIYR